MKAAGSRTVRLVGQECALSERWSEIDEEGLVLKVRENGSFEAHVVVKASTTDQLVAVSSLVANGLTGRLVIDSIATSPRTEEFYNFTISNVSFYSPYGDDLVERSKDPKAWLQEGLEALEAHFRAERADWAGLAWRAQRFLDERMKSMR